MCLPSFPGHPINGMGSGNEASVTLLPTYSIALADIVHTHTHPPTPDIFVKLCKLLYLVLFQESWDFFDVVGEDGNDPVEDSERGLWDDLQYLWACVGRRRGMEGGREGGRRRGREGGRESVGIGFQQTIEPFRVI